MSGACPKAVPARQTPTHRTTDRIANSPFTPEARTPAAADSTPARSSAPTAAATTAASSNRPRVRRCAAYASPGHTTSLEDGPSRRTPGAAGPSHAPPPPCAGGIVAGPGLRTRGIVGLTRRRPVGKTVATPRIGGGPSRAVGVGCPGRSRPPPPAARHGRKRILSVPPHEERDPNAASEEPPSCRPRSRRPARRPPRTGSSAPGRRPAAPAARTGAWDR